jgi:hypothetical protein
VRLKARKVGPEEVEDINSGPYWIIPLFVAGRD